MTSLEQRALKARSAETTLMSCRVRAAYVRAHHMACISGNLLLLCEQFSDELGAAGHHELSEKLRARAQKISRAKSKGHG